MKIPLQDQLRHYPFMKMGIYSPEILENFLQHIKIENNSDKTDSSDKSDKNDKNNKNNKNEKNEPEIMNPTFELKMNRIPERSAYDLDYLTELDINSMAVNDKNQCKSELKCCLPLNDKEYVVVHTVLECLIRYGNKFIYNFSYANNYLTITGISFTVNALNIKFLTT